MIAFRIVGGLLASLAVAGCCPAHKSYITPSVVVATRYATNAACVAAIAATASGGCINSDVNISTAHASHATSCTAYCAESDCVGTQTNKDPGGPVCVLDPATKTHSIKCTRITSDCSCG